MDGCSLKLQNAGAPNVTKGFITDSTTCRREASQLGQSSSAARAEAAGRQPGRDRDQPLSRSGARLMSTIERVHRALFDVAGEIPPAHEAGGGIVLPFGKVEHGLASQTPGTGKLASGLVLAHASQIEDEVEDGGEDT